MNKKPMIGIIASRGARAKRGSLLRFIKSHIPELSKYEIVTTHGTYTDLLVKFKKHLTIMPLRAGYSGGVIELASKVVDHTCQTIIFFSDSHDLLANSLENQTLMRQCIVHDAEFLQNLSSATIWAEKHNKSITIPVHKQTIALISHNAKKGKMLEFVSQHLSTFAKFEKIIATGTTGSQIKMLFPAIADKIFPMNSGPLGGDCQIANEIIENRCHHVIFFIDPNNPHPHAVDIQLFIRVCQQFKHINVNFLVTEKSAWRWIQTV